MADEFNELDEDEVQSSCQSHVDAYEQSLKDIEPESARYPKYLNCESPRESDEDDQPELA